MFTGTASRAGAVATATVIFVGAAILRGSAAAADPNQDDQFLASLDRHGIPALENAPSLIVTAHEVCGQLDGGMPMDRVVESMTNFAYDNDPSLNQYPRDRLTRTFSRFVTVAVQVYCPSNQGKIHSFGASLAQRINEPPHRVATYTHSDVLAALIDASPAGEIIAPGPPQIPAPSPPVAHIAMPPQAPAPSRPPRQPAPVPQQPPPPAQEPPPPQEVEPPAVAPQPGSGDGIGGGGDAGSGGGNGGGGDGGRGPAQPSPAQPMPPGIIRIAP